MGQKRRVINPQSVRDRGAVLALGKGNGSYHRFVGGCLDNSSKIAGRAVMILSERKKPAKYLSWQGCVQEICVAANAFNLVMKSASGVRCSWLWGKQSLILQNNPSSFLFGRAPLGPDNFCECQSPKNESPWMFQKAWHKPHGKTWHFCFREMLCHNFLTKTSWENPPSLLQELP